jgi:hypothetical protein
MKLGVFGGISYNGVKIDVLKSGINKYARRGMLDKLIYCVTEIEMFKELGILSKGVRSNMRNRIIICLNEDVGISDWGVYVKVDKGIENWEKNRELDNIEGKRGLIESLESLCESKKIRFGSIIRGFCYGYENKEIRERYKKNYEGIDEIGEICGEKYFNEEKDKKELKNFISGFVSNFDKKNLFCYYWMFKILNIKERCGRRLGKYKSCYVVWDILFDKIKESENKNLKKVVDILFKWFINYNNSRNENWLYLVNCVYFVMNETEYDWESKSENKKFDDDEINNFFEFNKNNKIELDDFLVDMHCSEGRKNKKNEIDFINSGMVIVNEYNTNFDKDIYEKIYIDLKKTNLEKKKVKKETENLDNLEFVDFEVLFGSENLNEKLCTKSNCGKAMCFRNNGKILKEVNKGFNFGKDCIIVDELKNDFGLKKINMKRVRSNKIVRRVDRKVLEWKNNMKIVEEKCVYLIMDDFENIGSLGDEKILRKEKDIEIEYVKIIMYRGIWRVTDGNYRNCLINKNRELLSIDENSILKRKGIFGKKGKLDFDKDLVEKSLKDLIFNKEEKLEKIKEKLKEFDSLFLYEEVKKNFDNLERDVNEELN